MVELNEDVFKAAQERAVNMHRVICSDGRGDSLTEHYIAATLLAFVMENKVRQLHGQGAEPKMDAICEWLGVMFKTTAEASLSPAARETIEELAKRNEEADTQELPVLSDIGQCGNPMCNRSARAAFCSLHGGA